MVYDLYAKRDFYEEDHYAFRDMVRAFINEHMPTGKIEEWDRNAEIPREVKLAAGEQGILGICVDEAYGGGGIKDYRFRSIASDEFARISGDSWNTGLGVHSDIVIPYLENLCTEEQKQRWLPKMVTGEWYGAICMTEPAAGSDLQGIRTTAVKDGDSWVVNGSKIFISNGMSSSIYLVAARTPDESHPKGGGITLFVIEDGMEGFSRGKKLSKIGMHGQDTAELFFDNVRVPAENQVGELHKGFYHMMEHLPLERLSLAAAGVSAARAALSWTIQYVSERKAFGKTIAEFQNTQFEVAEMLTKLEMSQAYIDQCILRFNEGKLSATDASKAKLIGSELQKEVTDRCLQLFGGYGFMSEYPIGRAYASARVTTIYGGTSEIMKLMIAREALGTR